MNTPPPHESNWFADAPPLALAPPPLSPQAPHPPRQGSLFADLLKGALIGGGIALVALGAAKIAQSAFAAPRARFPRRPELGPMAKGIVFEGRVGASLPDVFPNAVAIVPQSPVQHADGTRGRVDFLIANKNGSLHFVEAKRVHTLTHQHADQAIGYATALREEAPTGGTVAITPRTLVPEDVRSRLARARVSIKRFG